MQIATCNMQHVIIPHLDNISNYVRYWGISLYTIGYSSRRFSCLLLQSFLHVSSLFYFQFLFMNKLIVPVTPYCTDFILIRYLFLPKRISIPEWKLLAGSFFLSPMFLNLLFILTFFIVVSSE